MQLQTDFAPQDTIQLFKQSLLDKNIAVIKSTVHFLCSLIVNTVFQLFITSNAAHTDYNKTQVTASLLASLS